MSIFSHFLFRPALTAGITILLAWLINAYSMSQEGWLLLSAFLVSQTTRGTMLRQGLIYFLLMIIALLLMSLLALLGSQQILLLAVVVTWLLVHFIIYKNRPLTMKALYFNICFFVVVVFAAMQSNMPPPISARMMDVILGTLLGIFCGQFIFPVKFEQEFKQGVLPALNLLADGMQQFVSEFGNFHAHEFCQIEFQLQKEPITYPEWVYEAGFNPGLRSGFRFFLIHLERIMDLFSALNYLSKEPIQKNLLYSISRVMANSMEKNHELVQALINYFEDKNWNVSPSDYTSDLTALESSLQTLIPLNLELIDISADYMVLINMVRNMKDLRKLLLQLVAALPSERR